MTRVFLLVLDSLGIGGAPDAERFGDRGADTLGHIAEACAAGRADRAGLRRGSLTVPNLAALGLGRAAQAASGRLPPGLGTGDAGGGQWGFAVEQSRGKDTPSGHWEIAGMPVQFEWGYFPRTVPALPAGLTESLIRHRALPGILGNRHASGTEIIAELGAEHVRTGKPIVYTSADSVLQIAAHEEAFGLDRLYAACEVARALADPLNIGRVIARPFRGGAGAPFVRTAGRRDYATPPPGPTLLDRLTAERREVRSIGKIGDIFAHRGTGTSVKAADNSAAFDAILDAAESLTDGGLAIANFIDFDMLHGHRRDVAGYAAALEAFDRRLPEVMTTLRPGDLAVITADHGCDPTWRGTDHTRECVPVLAFGPGVAAGPIGRRASFADIGQTLARHLGIAPLGHGVAWG